jgi:hypothetical protein
MPPKRRISMLLGTRHRTALPLGALIAPAGMGKLPAGKHACARPAVKDLSRNQKIDREKFNKAAKLLKKISAEKKNQNGWLGEESVMNRTVAVMHGSKFVADTIATIGKRWMMFGAVALATAVPMLAQDGALQQKLAAVKQSVADNKQRLQHYQWIETTQLTLKGDAKPPSKNLCQYGPDGQVQKTPIGPPPPPPSDGRLKQRIIEKKKAEMKEYMDEVKGLLSLYVPPDPQKMQQAQQAGKFSLNPAGGILNFVFTDYAQPGDKMILSFDPAKLAIISLSVDTYMGESKDAVTLQVQMASLPDGTNYVQQTILNATAKQLVVTTTNSNYQKLGG